MTTTPTERDVALTVRVPESLRAIAKVAAARRKTTMAALVIEGLTNVIWPAGAGRREEDA